MNWANHLPIFVTKEYAGHSNIATTQEYYTLVDSDHDAKAQRIIQELLELAKTESDT
jgi:integrase